MVLYHLWNLYREDQEFTKVEEQLTPFKLALNRLFQQRHSLSKDMLANNLRKAVDEHFAILEPSLVKTRIYRITNIAIVEASPDQDTLSQLLQQQEEIKGSRVRYIAGILIMVGLLGTFLGLVQSVQYLQNFFMARPSIDFNALFSDMEQTLGGLDKAFGTSIGGITAYLVLGYLSLVLKTKQSRILNQLENLTLEELIPMFYKFREDKPKDVPSQAIDILQTIPATLSREVSSALEAIIIRTVGGSSENLEATGKYLQQAAEGIRGGQQIFTETLNAFGEFFTSFQEGREQLLASQETISEGIQKFSFALTHLEENQKMLTSSLEMTQNYLERSETRLNAIDEIVQKMHSIWTDNREVFGHLADTMRQEHQMLIQATEGLQDFLATEKEASRQFFQAAQQHIQTPIDKNTEVHQQLLESHTLLTTLLHDMKHFVLDEQNGLRLLSASLDETFGEAKLQYLQLTDYVEELHKRIRENQEQLMQIQETTTAIEQQFPNRRNI